MSQNEIEIEDPDKLLPEYNYIHWKIDYSTFETNSLDFSAFFNNYMLQNQPCLIKNMIYNWECATKWVRNDVINYDYFIEEYGDLDAPVADCKNIEFNSQCKCDIKVTNFINYLKDKSNDKLLYLKDWHLKRSRPNDMFYEVPQYFTLDWLNEYAVDNNEDDFMFVYIGPNGSWTPLHEDVYCSYSWSVNIIGRKKWILFPPGEEDKLKDNFGNLPLLFDSEKYKNIKYFEIIQEKGDAIFVPSGWHHQVTNEMETISINHNWINGCNIQLVWKALQKSLMSVEHQIEEFKDTPEFTTECQLILKSFFGMDFKTFVIFLMYIAKKRINQIQGKSRESLNKRYVLGKNIIKFDLMNILKVMDAIYVHTVFSNKKVLSSIEDEFLEIKKIVSSTLNSN